MRKTNSARPRVERKIKKRRRRRRTRNDTRRCGKKKRIVARRVMRIEFMG